MHTVTRFSTTPLIGNPTEFRIFKAGKNDADHDPALFDAQAARDVMADYAKRGVDLPIDLEHDSLDPAVKASRNDATDALGWFNLQVRNGELWAVNIRWTPAGAARLSSKSQRYTSPAFLRDPETGRVAALVNVALVAMPATYGAAPLVAASRARLPVRPLGRANSTTVAVRVSLAAAAQLRARAARLGQTPGELVRAMLSKASGLQPLLDLLGLPSTATAAEILLAVTGLINGNGDDATAPGADPTASVADSPPTGPSVLSRKARDYIAREGISAAEYRIRLDRAVRRH